MEYYLGMDTNPEIATLGPTGNLSIPSGVIETLGWDPGSKLTVTVEEGCLVLKPVHAANEVRLGDIEALRGILSSEKGMVEELQTERRQKRW